MSLFNKIGDCIQLGYTVSFMPDMLHYIIEVSKTDSHLGTITKRSSLPMHDHLIEEKIVHCIDWSIDEISKEFESSNKLKVSP